MFRKGDGRREPEPHTPELSLDPLVYRGAGLELGTPTSRRLYKAPTSYNSQGCRGPRLLGSPHFRASSSQSRLLTPFRGRETGVTWGAIPRTRGAALYRRQAPPLQAQALPSLALKGRPTNILPPRRQGPPHGRTPRPPGAPPAGTVLRAPMAPPIGTMAWAGKHVRTIRCRGAGLRVRTTPPRGILGCRTAASLARRSRVQHSPRPPNRASSLIGPP